MTCLVGHNSIVALCFLAFSQVGHYRSRELFMNATKKRLSVVVVGLAEGLSKAVFAHPSKTDATVASMGPVVSVSLSRPFSEILAGFLVGSGSEAYGALYPAY